jgi:CspA family cold shock protein
MQKGTVKWFNPTKGYGFIKPASVYKDVFVDICADDRRWERRLIDDE